MKLSKNLNDFCKISRFDFSYAPNGLRITEINDLDDQSDQPEIEIRFTPAVLEQRDISAVCQRDHPFFVKEKGSDFKCSVFNIIEPYVVVYVFDTVISRLSLTSLICPTL